MLWREHPVLAIMKISAVYTWRARPVDKISQGPSSEHKRGDWARKQLMGQLCRQTIAWAMKQALPKEQLSANIHESGLIFPKKIYKTLNR